MNDQTKPAVRGIRRVLSRRHRIVGWALLLLFLSLGGLLESMHALKIGYYLDATHSIRREMWTLAHAHGTLLAVINLLFAGSLHPISHWTEGRLRITSHFLIDASLLIPVGFFLGGITHSEGDPSWGVFLVPIGALLLFLAILFTVLAALASRV